MNVDEAFSLIGHAIESGRAAHGYLVCGDLRGQCDVLADRVLAAPEGYFDRWIRSAFVR